MGSITNMYFTNTLAKVSKTNTGTDTQYPIAKSIGRWGIFIAIGVQVLFLLLCFNSVGP